MEKKNLTSIDYAALEGLMQRIMDEYESEMEGIPTSAFGITKRTEKGIRIVDGLYDLYQIDDLAISGMEIYQDRVYLMVYPLSGCSLRCVDPEKDEAIMVDVTFFLDQIFIDLNYIFQEVEQQNVFV